MKTPEQYAKEAWCKLSLGNIARPANFDQTVRELTPYFEQAVAEARADERARTIEAACEVIVRRAKYVAGVDIEPATACYAAANDVRALASTLGGGER